MELPFGELPHPSDKQSRQEAQESDSLASFAHVIKGRPQRIYPQRQEGFADIIRTAALVYVLVLIFVVAACYHFLQPQSWLENKRRRLASREQHDDEATETKGIEACLSLQKGNGQHGEHGQLFPEKAEAVAGIVASSPQHQTRLEAEQQLAVSPSASLSQAISPAFTPSFDELELLAAQGETVWDSEIWAALTEMQWDVSEDAATSSSMSPALGGHAVASFGPPTPYSAQGLGGDSPHTQAVQARYGSSHSQIQGYSLQPDVSLGPSQPSGTAGPLPGPSNVVDYTMDYEQPGPSRTKTESKRKHEDMGASVSMTTQQQTELPQPKKKPKKHFTGSKSGKGVSKAVTPHPSADQASAPTSEEATDDRLARALEAVPLIWLPPPVEYPVTESSEGSPSEPFGSPIPSTSWGPSSHLIRSSPQPVPGPSGAISVSGTSQNTQALEVGVHSTTTHPLPGPATPMPPLTHLYYRLPILQPGVIRNSFKKSIAFGNAVPFQHGNAALRDMRSLFVKPTLTPEQASELITHAQRLVTVLLQYHRRSLLGKTAARAVGYLARRYMMLEALFCSIQVVGTPMKAEEWWPDVVQKVPTKYRAFTGPQDSDKTAVLKRLAAQLSAALESLKEGNRPSLEVTVALKRDLFSKDSPLSIFKGQIWDGWRNDDKEYEDSS